MVDRARALRPAEVESLVAMVHGSRTRQIERVNAVENGVRIAAEQVQDMRLQLLEKPPALDLDNLALQVGLTLVFETTILGAVSGLAASAFLGPLARAETGAQRAVVEAAQAIEGAQDEVARSWLAVRRSYPRATVGTSSPVVTRQLAGNISAAERTLGNARDSYLRLAVQAEQTASTHARFRRLVGGQEAENLGGAIQAAAAGWQAARNAGSSGQAPPRSQPLQPGAQLQFQAAAWAAGWRIGVDDRHDALDQQARRPGVTFGAALDVEAVLDPAVDIGPALQQIRASTVLTIEALIWAQLYGASLPPSRQLSDLARFQPQLDLSLPWRMLKSAAQGRGTQDPFTNSDIDPRLRDYWVERFGETAQAAAIDSAVANTPPSGTQPTAPAAGLTTPGWWLQSRVLRWLADLNDRYSAEERAFTQLLRSATARAP